MRRDIGIAGEQFATEHLLRTGAQILARNWQTRAGELDIVAFYQRTVIFVEVKTLVVKTRNQANAFNQWLLFEQITDRKVKRIRKLAISWLATTTAKFDAIRFDAIGVFTTPTGKLLRLNHLENAY